MSPGFDLLAVDNPNFLRPSLSAHHFAFNIFISNTISKVNSTFVTKCIIIFKINPCLNLLLLEKYYCFYSVTGTQIMFRLIIIKNIVLSRYIETQVD